MKNLRFPRHSLSSDRPSLPERRRVTFPHLVHLRSSVVELNCYGLGGLGEEWDERYVWD